MNTKENVWFNIENYKNIFRKKSNIFEFKPHDSRSAAFQIYRIGHDIAFITLSQISGVSMLVASETINYVCRVMVSAV